MSNEEVRTTSSTGGQKGVKPQRYDLLPKPALDLIAEVYAFGAEKYADHNWRKGYEWSKSYAALMRHLTAFWEGEDLDPESGLSHLGHAGFHIFTLLTFLKDHPGFDDRYATVRDREANEGDDEEPDGWQDLVGVREKLPPGWKDVGWIDGDAWPEPFEPTDVKVYVNAMSKIIEDRLSWTWPTRWICGIGPGRVFEVDADGAITTIPIVPRVPLPVTIDETPEPFVDQLRRAVLRRDLERRQTLTPTA